MDRAFGRGWRARLVVRRAGAPRKRDVGVELDRWNAVIPAGETARATRVTR
jgi:hypothetical protein